MDCKLTLLDVSYHIICVLFLTKLKIILGNEILRISFDYRSFNVAKEAIVFGASLQEILLQCDDLEIEKIGSAIFEMHKQEQENVIDFFCNQLIGSKQILKVNKMA